MHIVHRLWTWLWLACAIPALAGLVWAQAPKGKSAPSGPAAEAKSAAKDAAEGEAAAEGAPLPQITTEDPAVRAVLQAKPSTPPELVRAGRLLADLARPDLAKGLFKQVLDAGLDRDQLADLAEQLGSALFVQLVGREDLAPEGRQLAGAVLTAASQRAEDPQRIAGWIQKLQDPSPEMRYRAVVELQKASGAGVGAMVAVLADPGRAAEHANVQAALVQLGPDALPPLLGIVEAQDSKIAVQAIRVLGDLRGPDIFLYLLGPALRADQPPEIREAAQAALRKQVGSIPDKVQAARLLADRARRYFDRKQPIPLDFSRQVTLWSWDDAQKRAVARSYSVDEASRRLAVRFAGQAAAVMPEDQDLRVLHVATVLEYLAWIHGLDRPFEVDKEKVAELSRGPAAWDPATLDKALLAPVAIHALVSLDAGLVERALALAMEGDHAPAATAAAWILGEKSAWDAGQKEKARALLVRTAQPSALVLATRHSDRRLRLAAAEAIVRLGPAGPFPGSSWVLEDLSFLAASEGTPRALVASARRDDVQRVAGYLASLGYVAEMATSGAELLHLALASPDYELILVDAGIDRPSIDFLVQQIRNDGRTGLLPVGILARPELLARARHVAAASARVEAFPYPFEQADARWQVARLAGLGARDVVPAAQRLRQALRSLELLAELADRPGRERYDLRRIEGPVLGALDLPSLNARAAAIASRLGTPASQQALVELASRATAPLAMRQAAAGAFRDAVERHGLLLTTGEIRLQYDRYNRSAEQDVATQKVLGLILDSIEAPSRAGDQANHDAAEREPRMVSHGVLR